MVVEHFMVTLPGDLCDNLTDLANHAIDEAREMAETFKMPCNWGATLVKGEVGDFEVEFKVTRVSNA